MWGAVIGDFVGSAYEGTGLKGKDLPLVTASSTFTDDTVMTAATIQALLDDQSFAICYRRMGQRYPDAGFGPRFSRWLEGDSSVTDSYGNGAAMRVAPVALIAHSVEETIELATQSAICTHNSAEGIQGAQAVALAIYMARNGFNASSIGREIERRYFPLDFELEKLHRSYRFSASACESVPQAIFVALGSTSFDDCMRRGLYIGGDTDTILCMAGAIAEQLHGSTPAGLRVQVRDQLAERAPDLLELIERFNSEHQATA